MPDTLYAFLLVAVIALVTALLRFLPFWIFDGKSTVPAWLRYLSSVLPYAIMAMLVVYCLKDLSFTAIAGWLPAAICVAVVAVLQAWKRNTLLSIVGGTALYMLLLRFCF